MRHVVLPTEHSTEDLVLASHLVQALDSDTLYVAWTSGGGSAAPIVEAGIGEVGPRKQSASFFGTLLENVASIVQNLFTSPQQAPSALSRARG